MCLRDGEETVDDNEITKYNLFTKKQIPLRQTTVITSKKGKNQLN